MNWSQPSGGGTLSTFLFEALSGQDVHPLACGTQITCTRGFVAQNLYGYPSNIQFELNRWGGRSYAIVGAALHRGTVGAATAQVAEPGMGALAALGFASILLIRRRRPAGL